MRCLLYSAANLLLLISLLAPLGAAAQQPPPAAELSIKPKLCVRGTSADQCKLSVKINWSGNSDGAYCLYSDAAEAALRCWQRTASGEMRDEVAITADLNYWLTWQPSDTELARRTLQLLTAKSDDRRRSRRRRHVWSLF